MKTLLTLLFSSWLLLGCGDDGSATQSENKKTVVDSQLNAVSKVRNIENVLQQSADERQNELDVE